MEGVGGSADAYEEPTGKTETPQPDHGLTIEDLPSARTIGMGDDAAPPEDPNEIITNPEDGPPPWEPKFEGDLDESCAFGLETYEGAPEPISDAYECAGTTMDSEELMAVWCSMQMASLNGLLQPVALDTGHYNLERCMGHEPGWKVVDTGKDREYISEPNRCMPELADVPEDHLFIWVLDSNDRDGDELGYIQNGWVFLRKI